MNVAFIALNDGTDPRQAKICNSLARLGHHVVYIGWDRKPGKPRTSILDARVRSHIFEWPGEFGKFSFSGWPQFAGFVRRVLREVRPDVVHARDEQMAAFVLPLRGRYYRYLVLDIFDSLAARRFGNPATRAAAWMVRNLAHAGSNRLIETSDELRAMLGRHSHKAIVVMNTPPDPGEDLARQLPTRPALQVCTGGSLSRVRDGLEMLLQAIAAMPPGSVEVQASGWLHDDYARETFVTHPAVHYQWLDSPDDFRRQAAHCDALTYLRGDAGNSAYRAWVLPNRVFDAMSVGRPIIVSRKLGIAGWIEREGLGYAVDPGDYLGLAALFFRLREQRDQLGEYAARVRRLFVQSYTWELMEQRLAALYDDLAVALPVPTASAAGAPHTPVR